MSNNICDIIITVIIITVSNVTHYLKYAITTDKLIKNNNQKNKTDWSFEIIACI